MRRNTKEKFNAKNVKIKTEDLSITKIGELTTSEQSPIFILILFGMILVFIFFLPNIVDLMTDTNDKPDYSLNTNPSENKENDKENTEEKNNDDYYTFSDSLSIELEKNITINEFALSANVLSFKVTNRAENRFYFNKENYFLELYTEDNTLLERIILSEVIISRESSEVVKYTLSSNTALDMKKLLFTKKAITDYPDIVLEKDDNQEEVLTCTKDGETLTYKFQNEKLFSITHVSTYNANTPDYMSLYNNWKTEADNLNNMEGITSMFVDTTNGFIVNTSLDLKKAKLSSINNVNYYAYETLAKVVKFEMDSRGFSCK